MPQAPHLGDGFHLFDRNYLMLGFNTQRVCQATSLELEASFVPWISDGLFWGGFYAAAGVQRSRTPPRKAPSETENCFEGEELESRDDVDAWKGRDYIRYKYDPRTHQGGDGVRLGAGGEFGWRFLGLDVGYLHSTALVGHDHGMRMRVGISLADELFTGGMVKYAKSCCLDAQGCPDLNSVVPCECARTPVGISLFLYYGAEVYWRNGAPDPETRFWSDSMFGLSLKVAIGTPAWWGPR